MLIRQLATVAFITSVFFCLKLTWAGTLTDQETRHAPELIVVLKRGETKEVQLSWDSDTGRMPVIFLTNDPNLGFDRRQDYEGKISFSDRGLRLDFDGNGSETIQSELNTSEMNAGSKRRLTVASIRIVAGADATLGARSLFIHIVSGTGRNMHLTGEIRVLIRK
jgi:hypothetical protein